MISAQLDFSRGLLSLLKAVLGCDSPARPPKLAAADCFQRSEGALIVSHFANGTVRRENPRSGVVLERQADGGLTVSLPDGKQFFQSRRGAPVLVVDPDCPGGPGLGRMLKARIEEEGSMVYHYEDPQRSHIIVELSTLRHFRGSRPPVAWAR